MCIYRYVHDDQFGFAMRPKNTTFSADAHFIFLKSYKWNATAKKNNVLKIKQQEFIKYMYSLPVILCRCIIAFRYYISERQ